MSARPVASLGGVWHEHKGEAYPTCPVCLAENADLKQRLAKATELLEWSRSPDRYSESYRRITRFLEEEKHRAQGGK